MTNMNGIIIFVLLRKAVERQYVWKNKTKTKIFSQVSFMVPSTLPCIVAIPPLINTFSINILKGFWDVALSLCKPAK